MKYLQKNLSQNQSIRPVKIRIKTVTEEGSEAGIKKWKINLEVRKKAGPTVQRKIIHIKLVNGQRERIFFCYVINKKN